MNSRTDGSAFSDDVIYLNNLVILEHRVLLVVSWTEDLWAMVLGSVNYDGHVEIDVDLGEAGH